MLLENIFEKIGKGEKLSQTELTEFKALGNQLQHNLHLLQGWTSVSGQPNLMQPIIQSPQWASPPLHPLVASMQTDMTVTDNAAAQYVTFDDWFDTSDLFDIDDSGQKIIPARLDLFMQFGGVVQWEGNGTGYRAAFMEAFTAADVSMGQGVMHTSPGFAGVENWFPFYFMFDPFNFGEMSYFKFRVFQNSGGNLTLKSAHFGISVV